MISIIINTKDRLPDLLDCLQSILAQSVAVGEVIVVDASENGDAVRHEVESLFNGSGPRLKFQHAEPSAPRQMNTGLDLLDESSEVVGFFDDDVVADPQVLAEVVSRFQKHPGCIAVQGIEQNRPHQHRLGRQVRRLFGIAYEGEHWRLLPSGEHVMVVHPQKDEVVGSYMNGFTCVRREALGQEKFDEWFSGYAFLVDFEFSYRMARGRPMLISPAVKFHHKKYGGQKSKGSRLDTATCSQMFIINKTYIFNKHMPKKLLNQLAFAWSLIGHTVLNCGKSLHRRDSGFFTGTCRGILKVVFGGAGRV